MNNVSLLQAWMDWFNGNHVDDSVLWGLRILWWGRIGKGAEFLAATVILLEILGPERIRAFGSSLRPVTSEKLTHRLLGSPIISMFIFTIVGLICFVALVQIRIWVEIAPIKAAISLVAFIFLVIGLLFFGILSLMALGYLGAPLLRGVAVVLQFPAIDRAIKLTALLLMLLGFHFDLLSS